MYFISQTLLSAFFLLLASYITPCTAVCSSNKIPTIAVISYDTNFLGAIAGIKDGLAELNLHENKNLNIVVYDLKKNLGLIPAIINNLKQEKCNLIVTITTPVTIATKKALGNNNSIPIVFTMVADPIRSKIISSLTRPDNNITGITYNAFAMMPKRLELLREAFPKIQRIAITYNHAEKWIKQPINEILYPAAKALNFEIISYDIRNITDIEKLAQFQDDKIEGIFMVPDHLSITYFDSILKQSREHRLPLMVLDNMLLNKGGIMGYSPSFYSIGHQVANTIKHIIIGTAINKLPVQNPKDIELIVSQKEAQTLGITIDPSFLGLADKIIR